MAFRTTRSKHARITTSGQTQVRQHTMEVSSVPKRIKKKIKPRGWMARMTQSFDETVGAQKSKPGKFKPAHEQPKVKIVGSLHPEWKRVQSKIALQSKNGTRMVLRNGKMVQENASATSPIIRRGFAKI